MDFHFDEPVLPPHISRKILRRCDKTSPVKMWGKPLNNLFFFVLFFFSSPKGTWFLVVRPWKLVEGYKTHKSVCPLLFRTETAQILVQGPLSFRAKEPISFDFYQRI